MAGVTETINLFADQLEVVGEAFAEEFERRVKDYTPVVTGRLQSGWVVEPQGDNIHIRNDVEYAEYVEYGPSDRRGRMMTKTLLEVPDILAVATRKVGLTR